MKLTKPLTLTLFLLLLTIAINPPLPLFHTVETGKAYSSAQHDDLMEEALTIIFKDKKDIKIGQWLDAMELRYTLYQGSVQADSNDVCRNHYYNATTETGLSSFKDARTHFQDIVKIANRNWASGDYSQAVYNLGWACHLLQDVTVPHHTRPTPLHGHKEYEDWVNEHRSLNESSSGGWYDWNSGTHKYNESWGGWIHKTAEYTAQYYKYVTEANATEDNYTKAWGDLHRVCDKITAGFIYRWFEENMDNTLLTLRVTSVSLHSITVTWALVPRQNFSAYKLYINDDPVDIKHNTSIHANITDIYRTEYKFEELGFLKKYHIQVRADLKHLNTSKDPKSLVISQRTGGLPFYIICIVVVSGFIYVMLVRRKRKRKNDKLR